MNEGSKLWFQALKSIATIEIKGPAPSFDITDILLAIIAINNSFVGRKKLAYTLGLGEGAIRTLISRLKDSGLIETLASGCRLTEKGLAIYERINSDLIFFNPPPIIPTNLHLAGLVAKRLGDKIAKGLEERDTAVRGGAAGALILVVRKKRIIMPGVSDLTEEHPEQYHALMKNAKPEDGDLLIITWAEEERVAKKAAIAVAVSVIEKPSAVKIDSS
jgi:predicted transcriptional regulator